MAKFYVQSAKTQYVVSAEDAEGAALWVLNQVIQRQFANRHDADLSMEVDRLLQQIGTEGFLGTQTRVSEIGFDRSEAAIFDTTVLCNFWCQLSAAMNHLLNQLK